MKYRVLHCLESMTFGGVERRRLSIAKLLSKDLFELKIICTGADEEFIAQFKEHNVEIIQVGKLKKTFDWEIHRKVQKVIDDFKPHIIHGAVFEGVSMAAINGFIKRVPHIILEETSDPLERSWKANMLLKIYSVISDCFIAVSPSTLDYLKKHVTKNKAVLLNNGVRTANKIEPQLIKETNEIFGLQENDFVVGALGRLSDDSNKRFSDVIKAVSILKNKEIKVKMLLVGRGKETENYMRLAEELGISEQIIFTGAQINVDLFYQMMDAFCLVSTHESFGLVVVEAMMNKLPVIGTKIGGIQYIIKEEETGFLVNPKSPEEIAEKIEYLFNNKSAAEQMGEAGFKRSMIHYSEKVYVEKLQKLYSKLLIKQE